MSRTMNRILNALNKENGLTIDDIYAYITSLVFEYWGNNNTEIIKDSQYLAKKLIEIEDNERAYDTYFFVLINTNQVKKAYNCSVKLLKNAKFRNLALRNLSERIFVENGFMTERGRVKILKTRLSEARDDSEKNYILGLLKEYN